MLLGLTYVLKVREVLIRAGYSCRDLGSAWRECGM